LKRLNLVKIWLEVERGYFMICDECLEKKYTNSKSSDRSRGTCSHCGKEKVCNQIKDRHLKLKNQSKNAKPQSSKKAKCS